MRKNIFSASVAGILVALLAVSCEKGNPATFEDVLPGEFSVSSTKTVRFTKGNLTFKEGTFQFEDNQYDTPSSWLGTHISHFYWSDDVEIALLPSYFDEDASTGDVFFTNDYEETPNPDFSVNGTAGKYRTLSVAEWHYLFNLRADSGIKSGYATVAGVKGIILLPDSFVDPKTNNGDKAFVPRSSTGWNMNVYPAGKKWEAMEAAGAVFLPAAGYRQSQTVNLVDYGGYYWSSTTYKLGETEDLACGFHFTGSDIDIDHCERHYGDAVRLVADVN